MSAFIVLVFNMYDKVELQVSAWIFKQNYL